MEELAMERLGIWHPSETSSGVREQDDDLYAAGLWSSSSEGGDDEGDEGRGSDKQDSIDERIASLKVDMRGAARFKRRQKGVRSRRQAIEIQPTFEVSTMLGQANTAFAAGNFDTAQSIIEEVVRIDCNVFAGWRVLGEVHKEKGDFDRCLLAWMVAAHLKPKEAELWITCAQMSMEKCHFDQADYCYNKAIKANPKAVDVIWDRGILNRDHDHPKKAIECFKALLALVPNEMTTTRELAYLYLQIDRVEEAVELYRETSEHYMKCNSREVFGWSELNIMAELYIAAAEIYQTEESWKAVIYNIRHVSRWLRGREKESWWDSREDDAEWDDDEVRRKDIPRYLAGKDLVYYQIPLELRVKLGKARLALRDNPEAIRHFEFLDPDTKDDNIDLFLETGDALLKAECYMECLEYYSVVAEVEEANNPSLWKSMAKAFVAIDDLEQAEECYQAILSGEGDDTETLMLLAELYEQTGRQQDALRTVNSVIEIRRQTCDEESDDVCGEEDDGLSDHGPGGFFQANPNGVLGRDRKRAKKRRDTSKKKSKAELLANEARKEIQTSHRFKKLELSYEAMLTANEHQMDDWMRTASDLVDDFRNIKKFYPSEKKGIFKGVFGSKSSTNKSKIEVPQQTLSQRLALMSTRLEEAIDADRLYTPAAIQMDEFRGFHFSQWLDVFIQYAVCLTYVGEFAKASTVLDSAIAANVFYHHPERLQQLHILKMMLAIRAKDIEVGADQARWYMLNHLFRDDGWRFYMTALASGREAIEAFCSQANQKFVLRLVKSADIKVTGNQIPGGVNLRKIEEDSSHRNIQDYEPHLLMLYGHILHCGKSYTAASAYFARAYAIAPLDPMVIFSFALSYIHRAMQRQADNRHWQIVQGFTLMYKYYDLRSAGSLGQKQEAEYNLGRAFHQLGLVHLAMPYYERTLQLSRKGMKGSGVSDGGRVDYDLSWEAAYNLRQICILGGNTARAESLTLEFMSV